MHRRPQQGCPTAVRPRVATSPWRHADPVETADDAAGARRARDRRGVRGAVVVGSGAAGPGHTCRRRQGVGGAGCAAGRAGHRAAAARGLPAGVLRAAVGRCRRQRLRHPERRAGGVADRYRRRPDPAVPDRVGDAARPVHRAPRRLRPGAGDQRRGADRPRGGAGGRVAQGCRRLAGRPRARLRQRPGEPRADRGRGQPGQERSRRGRLAAAEPGLPLRLRGAAGPGEVELRDRRHQRGGRGALERSRTLPAAARCCRAVSPGR